MPRMEYDAIDLDSLANRSVRILADLHKEFYGVESLMKEPIRLAFLPLDREQNFAPCMMLLNRCSKIESVI